MITIGAPPMPLVVTPSQVPSCRNVGWVSWTTKHKWGGFHPLLIIFVLKPSNITLIMTSPQLLVPLEFEALVRRFFRKQLQGKRVLPSFLLSLWVLCDATLKRGYACVRGG
jgi:hypothetical protein